MSRVFTRSDVAAHNEEGDAWVIIGEEVYDVTSFAKVHPGGKQEAGKDATERFLLFHRPGLVDKYRGRLAVGTLAEKAPAPVGFGSMVPYGDPAWYQRFNSPYYKDTHVRWRARVRDHMETHVLPGLQSWCTSDRVPLSVMQGLGQQGFLTAMLGPPWAADYAPPHASAPDDFDSFHELILYDEIS
eukprot:gene6286-6101_t